MSLMIQSYLLEKYGPRLSVDQLAEVLGFKPQTVYNQVSAGTFPIPTYVDGKKRFAAFQEVDRYLEECRGRASSGVPA